MKKNRRPQRQRFERIAGALPQDTRAQIVRRSAVEWILELDEDSSAAAAQAIEADPDGFSPRDGLAVRARNAFAAGAYPGRMEIYEPRHGVHVAFGAGTQRRLPAL